MEQKIQTRKEYRLYKNCIEIKTFENEKCKSTYNIIDEIFMYKDITKLNKNDLLDVIEHLQCKYRLGNFENIEIKDAQIHIQLKPERNTGRIESVRFKKDEQNENVKHYYVYVTYVYDKPKPHKTVRCTELNNITEDLLLKINEILSEESRKIFLKFLFKAKTYYDYYANKPCCYDHYTLNRIEFGEEKYKQWLITGDCSYVNNNKASE